MSIKIFTADVSGLLKMRQIQPPKVDPYLFSSDDSQEEGVMGKDPDPSNCVMHIRIKPVMHIASDEEEVEMNSF